MKTLTGNLESEIHVSQYSSVTCCHVQAHLKQNGDNDSLNCASNVLPQFI